MLLLLVYVIWCCVMCYSWVQDAVPWRRGLQTEPHHCHLGRSDSNMLWDLCTASTHPPTMPLMFPSSLWQISTSARSCRACVREDSASTPLAASSVNVQEASPSTQIPESVKVLDAHRHVNTQVTYSSLLSLLPWDVSAGRKLTPAVEAFVQRGHMERERKKHRVQKDREILDLFVP